MYSWNELTAYVRAHYQYEEPSDGFVVFVSTDDQGRARVVILKRSPHPLRGEWVEMTTTIGQFGEVDINAAAQRVAMYPCGGLCIAMDMVLVRNTALIALMSESAFETFRANLNEAAKTASG